MFSHTLKFFCFFKNNNRLRLAMLALALIIIGSCQSLSTKAPDYLSKVVDGVQQKYAPDVRTELYQIQLQKNGDQLLVKGEVTNPELRKLVLDSLKEQSRYYDLIDSIRVLPGQGLRPKIFGIINVSVANMRREPSYQSELVNQSLLGTVVKLYKKQRGFYYCRNQDQYLGWITGSSFVRVDSSSASRWEKERDLVVTAITARVFEQPNSQSMVITDLVPTARLKKISVTGNWIKVALPDGATGFVERRNVIAEKSLMNGNGSVDREKILNTARRFLGVPYLWGGNSSKGFDCSGFVQTVFRINHVLLPRDASQMVKQGKEVKLDKQMSNLMPGDLLFFGANPDRITHVALYLGNGYFIQSSGKVQINSLDPSDPLYDEYHVKTLQAAKRILTDQ